jgi:four helix bundle protein
MTNVQCPKYDLLERTAIFGEKIIKFTRGIPANIITRPLISQLIRSATSIGANYCEADNALSKKDFIHKISICNKETKETRHWLRMLVVAVPEVYQEIGFYKREAQEFNAIFSSIIFSSKDNEKNAKK